jgi:hypothetical protein
MKGLPSAVVDWFSSYLPTMNDVRYVACCFVLRHC